MEMQEVKKESRKEDGPPRDVGHTWDVALYVQHFSSHVIGLVVHRPVYNASAYEAAVGDG